MATQNPMDLDDRVLSNAGAWWIGRLQTDADREHVVEAVVSEGGADGTEPAPGRSGSGHPSRPLQVLEIQGESTCSRCSSLAIPAASLPRERSPPGPLGRPQAPPPRSEPGARRRSPPNSTPLNQLVRPAG